MEIIKVSHGLSLCRKWIIEWNTLVCNRFYFLTLPSIKKTLYDESIRCALLTKAWKPQVLRVINLHARACSLDPHDFINTIILKSNGTLLIYFIRSELNTHSVLCFSLFFSLSIFLVLCLSHLANVYIFICRNWWKLLQSSVWFSLHEWKRTCELVLWNFQCKRYSKNAF